MLSSKIGINIVSITQDAAMKIYQTLDNQSIEHLSGLSFYSGQSQGSAVLFILPMLGEAFQVMPFVSQ